LRHALVDLGGTQGDILAQVSTLCQIAGQSGDGGVDRCFYYDKNYWLF